MINKPGVGGVGVGVGERVKGGKGIPVESLPVPRREEEEEEERAGGGGGSGGVDRSA